MGKGTIISHTGDGLYRVELDYGRARIDAEKARLDARVITIEGTLIPDAEADLAAAQVTLTEAGVTLDVAQALYKEGDKETADAVMVAQDNYNKALGEFNDVKRRINLLNLELADVNSRLNYINDNLPETAPIVDAWCADLTETLTGDVGTIETPDEHLTDGPAIQIVPGYEENATYDSARDGFLRSPVMLSPAEAFYNRAVLPGVQRHRPLYRNGIIKTLDGDSCTVELDEALSSAQEIDVNKEPEITCSIEYMECNGGVFGVGDHVVVMFSRDWESPVVIGFVSNPKACLPPFVLIIQSVNAWDKSINPFANIDTGTGLSLIWRVYWNAETDSLYRFYRENGAEIIQPTTEFEVVTESTEPQLGTPSYTQARLDEPQSDSRVTEGGFISVYSANLWFANDHLRQIRIPVQWGSEYEFNSYLSAVALSASIETTTNPGDTRLLGPQKIISLESDGIDTDTGTVFRVPKDETFPGDPTDPESFYAVYPIYAFHYDGYNVTFDFAWVGPDFPRLNDDPRIYGGEFGSHCAEGLPPSETYDDDNFDIDFKVSGQSYKVVTKRMFVGPVIDGVVFTSVSGSGVDVDQKFTVTVPTLDKKFLLTGDETPRRFQAYFDFDAATETYQVKEKSTTAGSFTDAKVKNDITTFSTAFMYPAGVSALVENKGRAVMIENSLMSCADSFAGQINIEGSLKINAQKKPASGGGYEPFAWDDFTGLDGDAIYDMMKTRTEFAALFAPASLSAGVGTGTGPYLELLLIG